MPAAFASRAAFVVRHDERHNSATDRDQEDQTTEWDPDIHEGATHGRARRRRVHEERDNRGGDQIGDDRTDSDSNRLMELDGSRISAPG